MRHWHGVCLSASNSLLSTCLTFRLPGARADICMSLHWCGPQAVRETYRLTLALSSGISSEVLLKTHCRQQYCDFRCLDRRNRQDSGELGLGHHSPETV